MHIGESKSVGPVRHHPMHNCLSLILRILTAGATAAAVVVMIEATQTVATPRGPHTARWRDFPAFKWFIVANAVAFVYTALATCVSCLSLCTRRGPLSYRRTAWLTFFVDFAMAGALMSAGSAALAVSWIGKHGQSSAQWYAVCPLVTKFCDYVQGALIACLCAWVFMALSTIVAVSALHNLASHRI
ncbi:hypothetical protein KC19_11G152500 [Ceratodon purpureus]|uniref:CASP-like protein n=1 Tax=Ceratodon purpureus TaxID=3225 RepID=A0A8T0GKY1_CERPU|nr:hypothetical protein KC19_11G152500 [Ceratodon purpureus]KAG0557722.1 hypothetical protein KC19_11G152500 [Ceratodon purpureus]KAG0557723.1 hypothetical protein KC19_11G152500 [Ceratodon purpureus]KAG0557724.1 hypothetical protein KC19_11G152500 [Ceratodon purpureus]KAG0557725.1 hypothetical protein KC19_11G152500 [Ceratodon purpureus]